MGGPATRPAEEKGQLVDGLLDTVVVVDLLRGYAPASQWITSQNLTFGVTRFVWLEVVRGCPNKRVLHGATQLLNRFDLVAIIPEDVDWALDKLTLYTLSHNIDPFDCLIAAVAFRTQTPLYTKNLKHFGPLLGGLVHKPY